MRGDDWVKPRHARECGHLTPRHARENGHPAFNLAAFGSRLSVYPGGGVSLLFAISLFALTMSISPGPVNLICLSTGANYGFLRTLPYVLGAALAFTALLISVGLGLSQVVERVPVLLDVMAYVGCAYICYLGYKIATSTVSLETHEDKRPGFFQGSLLQWLNPKAWIAALTCVSVFGLTESTTRLFLCAGVYTVVCFGSIAAWAYLGERLNRLVIKPTGVSMFNRLMGITLVLVAAYLLYLHLSGGQ
jgi:threonine/homoserine/homoserine lactone efflux protein